MNGSQSGIGLPHSTTSRKEWGAMLRASVVEYGSPMPLFVLQSAIIFPFIGIMLLRLGVLVLLASAATERSQQVTLTE